MQSVERQFTGSRLVGAPDQHCKLLTSTYIVVTASVADRTPHLPIHDRLFLSPAVADGVPRLYAGHQWSRAADVSVAASGSGEDSGSPRQSRHFGKSEPPLGS